VWFHHVACDPRSCAHLKSPTPYGIQPVRPASRVGTTRPRPVRSARSGQRIADRRCAAAAGGGARWRALGSCSPHEAFQGWLPPYGGTTHGAVPTWKAQPRAAYSGFITHLMSPRDSRSPRSARSGQRIAGRRCAAAAGEGGPRGALASCSQTKLFRVAAPYGGAIHGAMLTWKAQRCTACSGSDHACRVPRGPSRSLRPIRPTDRGSAVRCGVWGEGVRGEVGRVLGYEAFQGGCPIWCDPRSCAHLKSSTGYRIQPACLVSRVAPHAPPPVVPLDPACGSRTGGAPRRLGGRGRGERWAGARIGGVSGVLPHMVCDPRSCAYPEKPNGDCHTPGLSLVSRGTRSVRPVAPCDPTERSADRRCAAAGGPRRALRRVPGSCSSTRRFRVGFPHMVCDPRSCVGLKSPVSAVVAPDGGRLPKAPGRSTTSRLHPPAHRAGR
jgi:hypothetical protein